MAERFQFPLRTPGLVGCALLVSLLPAAASAQVAGVATVSGVVVDAGTGRPLPDARIVLREGLLETGAREDGTFDLRGVPPGTHLLTVRSFGYLSLTRLVTVGGAPVELRITLEPAPFGLEGLTVAVDSMGVLTGRVVDAESGMPLDSVVPWLPAIERGVPTDSLGRFAVPDVPFGPQLLQVARAGYETEMRPVRFGPEWEPVEIALRPDRAVLDGLPEIERRLKGRRNAFPGIVTTHDTERIARTGAEDVREYVNKYTLVRVVPCSGMTMSFWCIEAGGRAVEPKVCIDGWIEWGGLDLLQRMGPDELHLLEIYGTSGMLIRAYTHAYVEDLARGSGGVTSREPTPQREGVEGLGWASARSGVTPSLGPRC